MFHIWLPCAWGRENSRHATLCPSRGFSRVEYENQTATGPHGTALAVSFAGVLNKAHRASLS